MNLLCWQYFRKASTFQRLKSSILLDDAMLFTIAGSRDLLSQRDLVRATDMSNWLIVQSFIVIV